MYKQILVPLDGSDTARRGLTEAIGVARALGAQLRLLHVVVDFTSATGLMPVIETDRLRTELVRSGDELLSAAAKEVTAQGVAAESSVRVAVGMRPSEVIVDEAAKSNCDAIIMGTHGRGGMGQLLIGSDAAIVVRTSPVPVLLVRLDMRQS